VDGSDVVALLHVIAELAARLLPGCRYPVGEEIFVGLTWADVDCDLLITITDALWILRDSADHPFPVPTGCAGVGAPITV
jgi:hypothetical protein